MAAGSIRPRTFETAAGVQERYEVVVDFMDPLTGERRRRTKVFKTRAAAKRVLADWMKQADHGELTSRTRDTVALCAQRWLDTFARFKSPKTFEEYERTVNNHVVGRLGSVRIQQLTPQQVRQWIADMLNDGLGQRTVELAHMRLSQILDQALSDSLVPKNVSRAVKVPRPDDRGHELVVWSADEAQRFLAAAEKDAPYGPIFLVSLATGMREGELLGLRWGDIDWTKRELHVRQAVGTVRSRQVYKHLKSKSSRRQVLVDEHVLDTLKEWRARQNERRLALGAAYADNDLVFASEVGTPVAPRNLLRVYNRIIARCGIQRIRIHDQRHTHVTWALEDGVDLKTISQRVGHAKPTITATLYGQVTRRMQEDVAQKNAARLFGNA
jgi:integrase